MKRNTYQSVINLPRSQQAIRYFRANRAKGQTETNRYRYPSDGPSLRAQTAFHNDHQIALSSWISKLPSK
jgi:hypothetical protein